MAFSKSQKFSQQVFETVSAQVSQRGQGDQRLRKYKGLCKRSGGMLRTTGLIQYLTFLKARGQRQAEIQHHDLLEDLYQSCRTLCLISNVHDVDDFLVQVRKLELPKYMHLTREVLHLLDWYKRMADILIVGTADEFSEED